MRKVISAALVGVIALISISRSDASTIKPGTPCIKIGAKQTQKNTIFTCVKVKGKLVWNSGVTARSNPSSQSKPTPTPSPSATPSLKPSPSPSPAPTPTKTPETTPSPSHSAKPLSDLPGLGPTRRIEYRFINGKMERKNIDGIWLDRDTRSESVFDSIRVAAYKSIRSASQTSSSSKIIVKEYITDNYPKELVAVIRDQISEFNKVLSPFLVDTLNMNLVLVTEKDKDFVKNDLPKIIEPIYYGKSLEILDEYTDQQSFYRRSGTGGGTAGFDNSTGRGFYIGNTASFAEMKTFWPEIAPHEMAHAVQFFLARGFANSCGEGEECGKWHGHLIEGSANAVGMSLGFPYLGWYSDEMDKLLKFDIQNYKSWKPMSTTADAVAFFKAIESRESEQSNMFSYSAGQILWEYYIATYGFQKWIDLYSNLPKTANFNDNLKRTIGIDKQSFYENAAPYFLSVWKRLDS